MIPVKSHEDDSSRPAKREMHGPRPSPLRINKESHFIHKSSTGSSLVPAAGFGAPKQQQQRLPVIIYAHSPKVIHTQARDFMAMVQKLTGLSRSPDHDDKTAPNPRRKENARRKTNPAAHLDENESSSVLTDENCGGDGGVAAHVTDVNVTSSSSSVSPAVNPQNQYLADMPLFTPNSSDLLCSPRPVFRFPDPAYGSPSVTNSISPSVFDFLKGLPDY